ncbi:MAG: Mu transposase C-terminal domain-containing protein [Candidatus Dormibacteria bacterium]|jgi:putative transposase
MRGKQRHGGPYVSEELRDGAVSRLLALREGGDFRSDQVALVAEQLGVAVRTVWGWLKVARTEGRNVRKRRARLEVTEADVIDLAYHRGNVAAFHRARGEAGPTPGIDAWRQAFRRRLSPGQRAGLVHGERVRRDYDTYLTRTPQFRNEQWEADHTQLAIAVGLPDGRVVKPWATLFLDCFSRAIAGYAITVTPSRESILAALRSAIMVEPPYGPIGGVPLAIRFDRGRDFLAEAIRVAAGALVIDIRPVAAYTPHLKGAIERANGSIETLLLGELPGFLHGARDRAGKLIGAGDPLLSLEAFVKLFDEFIRWYHAERPHQSLDGRTPLQVWNADPTPLSTIEPQRLRHLMLAGVKRTVTKKGVRLGGRRYNGPELCGHVGDEVEVRHMPHHEQEVEVFLLDGHHLGTAYLVEQMTPAERRRFLDGRAEGERWLSRVLRSGEKRRRTVYAAMTAPGPAVVVSALTEEVTASQSAAQSDAVQRQLASRSLARPPAVPARMTRPRVIRGGAA